MREEVRYRLCPRCGVLIDCASVQTGSMRISCACGYVGSFVNDDFEIMPILVDSREKRNEHIIEYFDKNNIAWKQRQLNVGDYMIDGNDTISIDKKYGCEEVAANMSGADYSRFRRELLRAIEAHTRLIVLIEEPTISNIAEVMYWKNWRKKEWDECKRKGDYAKMKTLHLNPKYAPINGSEIMQRMLTIKSKYNVDWRFTTKSDCGKRIVEILGGAE